MNKYSCSAVICDIEGTTTSINFVKNVLFPYSYNNVNEYLKTNWNESIIQEIVKEIINLRSNDEKYFDAPKINENDNQNELIESITNTIKHFIDKDYKIGPLKKLQGLIWEYGYKDGKFKGHVYDDVPKQFHKWHNDNIKIYIYSSGSIKAQKLLFEYSDHGNLLPYIDGHFDTTIGYKQDKHSYMNILKEINYNGNDVIFLTDIPNEAYAANDAGIKCILLDRNHENNVLTEKDRNIFPVVETFEQIELSGLLR